MQRFRGRRTIAQRMTEFEEPVRSRLRENFRNSGIDYPPSRLTLIGLKAEQSLEVWAAASDGRLRLLKTYRILGTSGTLGPKLAEGDRQIPEGLYRIESLNPNSAFHLALRVNYPNEFDRKKGALDGRTHLGSDIMIHGSSASIGCLAMGDEAAEELFILAARAGVDKVSVILSPVDFRRGDFSGDLKSLPAWTPELYSEIKRAMLPYQ